MLRRSLAARLVLLLSLGIGLVLTGLAALEFFLSRDEILDRTDRRTQRTIDTAVTTLENRLATLEETTKLLAEILVQEEESEEELVEILRQAVDERSDIFGAAIALDPRWTGKPLRGFAPYFYYAEGEEPRYMDLTGDYDYTGRAWFREPRDRERAMWSEPYFDRGGAEIAMATFSAPMFRERDGGREFYGVVTADIALSSLGETVSEIELGDSGFAFLLSRSARLIAAPRPGTLLQPMLQTLPVGQNMALWTQLLNDAGEGRTVSSRIPCHGTRGKCMLKLSPLETTGWPLGIYYSEREMLEPLREYLFRLAASTALTLALLSLIVTLVIRRITQPLTALARASGKVAGGDFSTPTPPTKRADEVGRLINAFATMQFELQDYIQQLRKETASRNRLEGELDAARDIQMAMLPAGGRPMIGGDNFQLWATLQPARLVGGDLYNYYILEDGKLLIAVGDVSDKGVPAALFMSRVMTLLQELDMRHGQLGDAMARLNNALARRNENCMFVTLFLGRFDPASRELEYCSAGHPPPSLLRGGRCTSLDPERGPALGLANQLEFPVNAIQLEPNDLLTVYSDGIDEAFSESGELYGIERFNSRLEAVDGAALSVAGAGLLEDVSDWAGARPQSDDISLLLLRVAPQEHVMEIGQNGCREAMAWLRELTDRRGVDPEPQRNAILLAEEVLTNIEKYGGLEHGDKVVVAACFDARGLELSFTDPGVAFNPFKEGERANLGEESHAATIGGLGVHLLEVIGEWHHYDRIAGHNVLRLGIGL